MHHLVWTTASVTGKFEGMWGRRKRGDKEGEGEHFYPLQHPKDRSVLVKVIMFMLMTDHDDQDGGNVQNREDAEVLATILSQT